MQDIIARALALRNNGSSSGASAELVQKVQKIEDEYVRSTDEKDIEEISSSIEAIKQEIVDKGAEVKESLDLNSAIKSIRPLSEIANYGGKYACTGSSEFARITSETKAEGVVFIAGVAKEGIIATTIQFWDSNKKTYNIAIKLYAMIHNDGSSLHVLSDAGNMRIDYNADGTFKAADTTNLYIGRGHVLDKYNTTEYTPTKDYHPATKKYVDDTIPASLKNPFSLTFTGAVSATYDGSEAVTVDLPSGGSVSDYETVTVTLDADVSRVDISKDAEGVALSAHEVYWIALTKSTTTNYEKYTVLINGGWNDGDPYIAPSNTTSKSTETWLNSAYGHMIVRDGIVLSTNMTQGAGRPNALGSYSKYTEITSVNFCNASFAAGCKFILIYR